VPGFRDDLVAALLRGLPKQARRELVPMNEVIGKGTATLRPDGRPIGEALADAVHAVAAVRVRAEWFDTTAVPAHLRVNFAIDDERGRTLASGKDLDALRAQLAPRVRAAIARQTPIDERTGITAWDFGDLPASVE